MQLAWTIRPMMVINIEICVGIQVDWRWASKSNHLQSAGDMPRNCHKWPDSECSLPACAGSPDYKTTVGQSDSSRGARDLPWSYFE